MSLEHHFRLPRNFGRLKFIQSGARMWKQRT